MLRTVVKEASPGAVDSEALPIYGLQGMWIEWLIKNLL